MSRWPGSRLALALSQTASLVGSVCPHRLTGRYNLPIIAARVSIWGHAGFKCLIFDFRHNWDWDWDWDWHSDSA
eukprot:1192208-Prorocentrum_minimum.AAC.20